MATTDCHDATVVLRLVSAAGSLGDIPAERDWSIAEVKRHVEEVFGVPKDEQDLIIGPTKIPDDDEALLGSFLLASCDAVDCTLLRVPIALKEQRVQKDLAISKVQVAVAGASQTASLGLNVQHIMQQAQQDLHIGNTAIAYDAVRLAISACPPGSDIEHACKESAVVLRDLLTCETILHAGVEDPRAFRSALEEVFQRVPEPTLVSQMLASYKFTMMRMHPSSVLPQQRRPLRRRVA